MAQVSISNKAQNDLRFDRLALALGLPSRWDALGRIIPVWNICAESESPKIEKEIVNRLMMNDQAADKLVAVGLAKSCEKMISVAGYKDHCKWLSESRAGGKKGGKYGKLGGRPVITPPGVMKKNPPAIAIAIGNISGSETQRIVSELWAKQEVLRKQLNPRCSGLKLTAKNAKRISDLLASGVSFAQASAVLDDIARECSQKREQLKWFNGETNWREDNFRRRLGQIDDPDAVVEPSSKLKLEPANEPKRYSLTELLAMKKDEDDKC